MKTYDLVNKVLNPEGGKPLTKFSLASSELGVLDKMSTLADIPDIDISHEGQVSENLIKNLTAQLKKLEDSKADEAKIKEKKQEIEKTHEIIRLNQTKMIESTITLSKSIFMTAVNSFFSDDLQTEVTQQASLEKVYESLTFVNFIRIVFEFAVSIHKTTKIPQIFRCPKCKEFTDVYLDWRKYFSKFNNRDDLSFKLPVMVRFKEDKDKHDYQFATMRFPTVTEVFSFVKDFYVSLSSNYNTADSEASDKSAVFKFVYSKTYVKDKIFPLIKLFKTKHHTLKQIEENKNLEPSRYIGFHKDVSIPFNTLSKPVYDEVMLKIIHCGLSLYEDVGLSMDIDETDLQKYHCNEKTCGARLPISFDFSNFFFFLEALLKIILRTTLTQSHQHQKLFLD